MPEHSHTFVIPAFGESDFLEECILSLLKQTLPSRIMITTSTPNQFISGLALKYKIELRINKNRESIAADWTFAYKNGQTNYLTIAHQDDIYLPDYTQQCLHVAKQPQNRDSLIIFTNYGEISDKKPRRTSTVMIIKQILLLPFHIRPRINNHFLKSAILSFGNPISCPTVMFNRENTGAFEFSEKYSYNLDWEAWLRLAGKEGKFIYLRKKLMFHRLHPESQTTLQVKNNNRLSEEEKIFGEIWNKPMAKVLMFFYRMGAKSNL